MAKPTKQTKEDIKRLKEEYIAYFADVPVHRYAAQAIGRSEDAVLLWRKDDAEFSARVNQAEASWVRKKVMKVKAEFALERLQKQIFKETTETTVHLPSPILGGVTNEVRTDYTTTTH